MTYTVKAGDTLTAIAVKNNTTVDELVRINGIKNRNVIYVGQVLKISERVETPVPKDSDVAKALQTCISDIEKLDSFKQLCDLL